MSISNFIANLITIIIIIVIIAALSFCNKSYALVFNVLKSSNLSADSPIVHILSASCAGFASATATNPIWFVKTRLQLDHNSQAQMTVRQCMQKIYRTSGILGFYKGITASYFGISETVIHFVIYEAIKAKLVCIEVIIMAFLLNNSRSFFSNFVLALKQNDIRRTQSNDSKSSRDFFEFMVAGAISKTIASCVTYPHEVARTRLREEGTKYRQFWQTIHTVWKEEGKHGLYR